jgi:hypothetical protein
VFESQTHFLPSLIITSKAGAYPGGAPERSKSLYSGVKTLRIMTLSITPLIIKKFNIVTLNVNTE